MGGVEVDVEGILSVPWSLLRFLGEGVMVGRRVGSRVLVMLGATVVLVAGLMVCPMGAELPPVGDWAVGWGSSAGSDLGRSVAVDASGMCL